MPTGYGSRNTLPPILDPVRNAIIFQRAVAALESNQYVSGQFPLSTAACPGFIGRLFKRPVPLLIGIVSILGVSARADLWRTGYYPGWEQSAMPAGSIDFNALTHIIHFSHSLNIK